MPSANKTSIGLNQWQANEYPKMADFNEDNRIIDEKITELQSGSGVKIYTTTELSDPQEGKIYNVKIEEATSTINEKPVYKENTTQSVTLKAGKVATVYFSGGNFFYKASASGNAIAENVLADKKFSNDDDTDITGTMENHGAKIFKPSTANIIIPKGFHDGTGYVEGDSDLVAGNIVQGKQIFGVNGNALKYEQSEKTSIANALTSKGVPTSTTASWSTIEKNIRDIVPRIIGLNRLNDFDNVHTTRGSDRVFIGNLFVERTCLIVVEIANTDNSSVKIGGSIISIVFTKDIQYDSNISKIIFAIANRGTVTFRYINENRYWDRDDIYPRIRNFSFG